MARESDLRPVTPLLDRVHSPADLRRMSDGELAAVADELRAELISAVSQTGGHLGSSLGVVELTVAIHAVFNTPYDKLIWDVGHQCYPHKIVTGRRGRIRTLRQAGGLSGFTKRSESPYDPFGAAHSSTSISAGLGLTVARDLGEATGDVVTVIGDGAISAGMAYEAMNNAGADGRRMFVILNDNEMSIAPPVGAMSKYLVGALCQYPTLCAQGDRRRVRAHPARAVPRRRPQGAQPGHRHGRNRRHALRGAWLFLCRADRRPRHEPAAAGAARGPGTGDGSGADPLRDGQGQGLRPGGDLGRQVPRRREVRRGSGAQAKAKPGAPSYTSVFGKALVREAEADPRIVAITAAMPDGTGVNHMAARFPARTFDVGIAEQHAVTFAGGLAAGGLRPFCAIYSTFLQRAFDQVVHDIALQKLPVRFAIDRAGLVGADGATHAGAFDVGYLSNLPGFTVMAAGDEAELVHMVHTAAAWDEGPIAFRYPRGEGTGVALPDEPQVLEIGKGRVVREGSGVAILSFGAHLQECLEAAQRLAVRGISATVADARFAKPLDTGLIDQLIRHHPALVTVEEGAEGGFGARVLHWLAAGGRLDRGLCIRTMTLPDRFIDQASPKAMYADAGLAPGDIEATCLAALGVVPGRFGLAASA